MRLIKQMLCIIAGLLFTTAVFSQKQNITGTVTDPSGNSIDGASVTIKSSKKGVTTKSDGSFSIEANADDILEISAVGHATETISLGGRTSLVVQLQTVTQDLSQIVMVGSRSAGRIKTETAVPVDIIKLGQGTLASGRPDLTSILNYAAPSFNFNKQSGSDGADHLNLATLRGMNPDQTLVLINGKRRHQTAFVAVFGTKGRGASGTDLNTIPIGSIDHVEILRDGASAQYGSDAIAGVLNIILKKNTKQLTGDVGYSAYLDTKFNPYHKKEMHNQYLHGDALDGQNVTVNLNYGLPIGSKGGFVNFTGNYSQQGKTFRQVLDTSFDIPVLQANEEVLPINPIRRANGDASMKAGGIFYNLEIPVGTKQTKLYSFGGFNLNHSDAYAFTRYWQMYGGQFGKFPTDNDGNLIFVPGIMRSVPLPDWYGAAAFDTVYDPHIQTHVLDLSGSIGFKGVTNSGWNWDLSNTTGRNDFHYYGDKTFNASLGTSQTHFDDGGFNLLQNTTNADVSKKIAGVGEGLNLGFGAEFRFENYQIYKGEINSYTNFDPTSVKFSGAQGYPGYKPSDEVDATRSVVGAYVDAELDVTKKWLLNGAIRVENYDDFGFTSNYKLATRYKVSPDFNIRGSVSTGFRAPSLAQINFSNVFSQVAGSGISYLVQIAPNSGDLAKAMGLPDLKQEKSGNASLGFTWKPMKDLSITLDGYYVKMKDRIVLSGIFDTTIAALKAYNVTHPEIAHAQFFTNAVNTSNYGLDLVVDYKINLGQQQRLNILFAGNIQKCKIDKINIPPAFNGSTLHQQLFYSPREQGLLIATAPPQKFVLNLEYGKNKFTAGARFTYFGKLSIFGQGNATYSPPFGVEPIPVDDYSYSVPDLYNYKGKVVSDLYFSYKICKSSTFFIGADNIFNVHPTLGIVQLAKLNDIGDTESGGPWDAVQMGSNGMRLFAKLSFKF
ncbi:MAG: TonB-dependent receptor [Bacteroidota bacterium]